METELLSKEYEEKLAVNQVNMHIPEGQIYGFIGKNGAGKTTLIRMLTGLTKPTEGRLSIFQKESLQELEEIRKLIGSVVEVPTFYGNMTGRENLEMHQKLLGLPKNSIDEAISFVDAEAFLDQPANTLSMGQRQRMGLARAVMGKPKMLILDEPTNGVDPEGIVEFRKSLEFLRTEYNTTILISSHILSELSQMATWYGVIDQGVLLDEFPASALKVEERAEIFTQSSEKLCSFIEENYPKMNPLILPEQGVKIEILRQDMPALASELISNNFLLFEIRWVSESLENRFIHLTQSGVEL